MNRGGSCHGLAMTGNREVSTELSQTVFTADELKKYPTVRAIAASVHAGEKSPVDTVQESLAAIADKDGEIGAFREVWADDALATAEALANRDNLSELPLAGVPFAVKENTPRSNPIVQKLEAAGAIAVGSTINPQFCTWGVTDEPGHIVRNPVRPGRTPGGSSGGSSAAVAAGMVPFAQGNDGMGSLRIPAAACNLSTLKTTPGVIAGNVGGNNWFGMAVQGVLTLDVDDLILITKTLTDDKIDAVGHDAPATREVFVDTASPVTGIPVDKRWKYAAETAAKIFADAGVTVHSGKDAKVPYPLNPVPMLARWTAGVADSLEEELKQGMPKEKVEWRNRVHAGLGNVLRRSISEKQVARARAKVEEFLPADGVIITPAFAAEPPKAGSWHKRPWLANMASNMRFSPFVSTWNYLEMPAGIVVEPITGLPVQVIGRQNQEHVVLAAMKQIAQGSTIPRQLP